MKFTPTELATAMGVRKYGPDFLKLLSPVGGSYRPGWNPAVTEPFAGAWQRNIELRIPDILCYPAVYACVMRISQDIGKLPFEVEQRDAVTGLWRVVDSPTFGPVLRKPNHYQTQAQFREQWVISKLNQGNTYVLKGRNREGKVERLYVLDPARVMPLVSESGDVYYQLSFDGLNTLPPGLNGEVLTVPASEIIHDREATMHNPLIGVPPLCAAYWPAVKNMRILRTSAEFFANGASPGGILVAPGAISADTADRLSAYWNTNFTGENAGRTAVVGDGLKYEQLSTTAVDSQLVEQMKYSDEQICQAYGVPPFKIGLGALPAGAKVDDVNNLYYSDALQARVQHMEGGLTWGLEMPSTMSVNCDEWPLLRMDRQKLAQVEGELVKSTIKTPNEARREFDLDPKTGGDSLYLQQQNYSLEALAKRDAQPDPFGTAAPAAPPAPAIAEDEEDPPEDGAQKLLTALIKRFEAA